ncbi:MAG: transcriptional regulator [Paenibacillus sp.]|nr:transcriptional regulator [Paenibacillus sp.]
MRPIDIANKLNVSTSALRNYEANGLVPPTERSTSGYRLYTNEHLAYFECIQAMAPGFGMDVTSQVLRHVQTKQIDSALSLVSEAQANLRLDTKLAENNVHTLEVYGKQCGYADSCEDKEWKTIGEVSAETSLPSSTIRHWEKEGLIASSRDPHNGYRLFNRSQIRKISLLRALRPAPYSETTVELKQAIALMNEEDSEQAGTIARATLSYLLQTNRQQIRGVYYLYALCRLLKLLD